MQIRKLTLDDIIAFEKAQSICFLYPMDVEASEKRNRETPEKSKHPWSWGAFDDDGKLASGMSNYPYGMYYDGQVVGMGAIGGVVSLPEARAKGNIRELFRHVFADGKARGELFSTLYPFSHRYYRQFGYEVCHSAYTYAFPTEALSAYRLTCDVRMHKPGDSDEDMRRVYDQFACRYTYAVARTDGAWERALRGDPLKKEAYRYILSKNGEPIAYCAIKPIQTGDFEHAMLITDFAYVDKSALHQLFGFFFGLRAQFQQVRMETPTDVTLASLIDEPYDLSVQNITNTMARVLDVERALNLMRHPAESGSYRLAVEDTFLPENSGTYVVTYGDGNVTIAREPLGAPCDMAVSVQAFAQMCLGYAPYDTAALRRDVTANGNADTLRRVFIAKPRTFADRF